MEDLPLVLCTKVRQRILALRTAAEQSPFSLETLQLLGPGDPFPKELLVEHTMVIPMGFTVTFTYETQVAGLFKHLSMSVHLDRKLPRPTAVQTILEEFGFVNPLALCVAWPEDCGEGQLAINVMEPADGDWDRVRKGLNK